MSMEDMVEELLELTKAKPYKPGERRRRPDGTWWEKPHDGGPLRRVSGPHSESGGRAAAEPASAPAPGSGSRAAAMPTVEDVYAEWNREHPYREGKMASKIRGVPYDVGMTLQQFKDRIKDAVRAKKKGLDLHYWPHVDKELKTQVEALIASKRKRPKGAPTRTNISTMNELLRKHGGRIPPRIDAGDYPHIKRCLDAGLLEQREDGHFHPTEAGRAAMAEYGYTGKKPAPSAADMERLFDELTWFDEGLHGPIKSADQFKRLMQEAIDRGNTRVDTRYWPPGTTSFYGDGLKKIEAMINGEPIEWHPLMGPGRVKPGPEPDTGEWRRDMAREARFVRDAERFKR